MSQSLLILVCFYMSDPWEITTDSLSEYVLSIDAAVVTPEEELFLLDRFEYRIFHLDKHGRELKWFGRRGDGPGELQSPYQLQYQPLEKRLYVTDYQKAHLIAFHRDGRPVAGPKIPARESPWVLNGKILYVHTYDPFVQPGLGAEIYLEDLTRGSPELLLKNGPERHEDPRTAATQRGGRGFMDFPWSTKTLVAVTPDLHMAYLGSNATLDFLYFDLENVRLSAHIREPNLPRVPLIEEEIEKYPPFMDIGGKRFDATSFEQPNVKPAIAWIMADTQHRLWVRLAAPWQTAQWEYRVFSKEGGLRGRLSLPAGFQVFHATGDHLWGYRHYPEKEHYTLKKIGYEFH